MVYPLYFSLIVSVMSLHYALELYFVPPLTLKSFFRKHLHQSRPRACKINSNLILATSNLSPPLCAFLVLTNRRRSAILTLHLQKLFYSLGISHQPEPKTPSGKGRGTEAFIAVELVEILPI